MTPNPSMNGTSNSMQNFFTQKFCIILLRIHFYLHLACFSSENVLHMFIDNRNDQVTRVYSALFIYIQDNSIKFRVVVVFVFYALHTVWCNQIETFFFGDVVLGSINMTYTDLKYKKQISLDLYYEDFKLKKWLKKMHI